MKKIFFILIIGFLVFTGESLAQADIQYPVKELGNCEDRKECKKFCDNEENIKNCIDFAEKNKLISQEEANLAKNLLDPEKAGPGGCKGKESCEKYCDDIANINECVAFAEENNLMPPEELAEAKKVQAAIAKGIKPPPCKNKKACDNYCENSDHMEECITFAKEAGFIEGKELEDAQKMLQAIKKGVKPPPCRGKEACDEYCGKPENAEVCINFALEAGFMPEEEKEGAVKMLQAIKKGVKPPPCKGKGECDIYCGQEEHFEECLNFSEAAGFMSAEDAAMARKTGGKGPGDCKGKEECEAYCKDPANQETCFNFAKENGLIPEEDLKKMEEGGRQFKEALRQAPPEVAECLKARAGKENIDEIKNEEIVRQCFEEFGVPRNPEGDDANFEPKQTGPGGCQSPEECEAYCNSNPQECGAPPENSNLAPQEGSEPPEGYWPEDQNLQQEGQPMSPPEGFRPPEGYLPEDENFRLQPMLPPDGSGPSEDFKPPTQEPPPPTPEPSTEPSPQASILKLLLGTILSALKY